MSDANSLTLTLESWFDKPLMSLPEEIRKRVEEVFFPFGWDKLLPGERRSFAIQCDEKFDPAHAEKHRVAWEESLVDWRYWATIPLLSAQEFCILRHIHDPRDYEARKGFRPDGVGKLLGERVSDDLRIIERSIGTETLRTACDWVKWAQQQSWAIPAYLRFLSTTENGCADTCRVVNEQHSIEVMPAAKGPYTSNTVRREARKLDTQAMHRRWQKAYQALKRMNRDKSDVWCSLQIAKTDNPQGRSAETIRKHMKK